VGETAKISHQDFFFSVRITVHNSFTIPFQVTEHADKSNFHI